MIQENIYLQYFYGLHGFTSQPVNECREKLEMMIDLLHTKGVDKAKPRDYRRVARKEYPSAAKKNRKTKKEVRRGIRSQLQYTERDLRIMDALLKKPGGDVMLGKRERGLLAVIKKVYAQQKHMYDNKTHQCGHRIVNLYQPHVRPMPRGKDKNDIEFGAKINIGEVNGFVRIDRMDWETFNEGGGVKMQVMDYFKTYGRYPEWFLADQIYLNRKKKKDAERNHVEGKFGQGKRGYRLNDIKARLPETSESWINTVLFVMNLVKLVQAAEKYANIIFETLLCSLNLIIKGCKQYFLWNTQPCTRKMQVLAA